MAMKYNKEFVKPDGRRLPTGGPRDLQRRQRQESREQTELIDFLRNEIRDLNERLAVKSVGTGEYTGDQVDDEIRKAVSAAVEEVKVATQEEMSELRSAADALKKNENNLLDQIKNLEVYQVGIQKDLDDTKRLLEEVKSGGDPDELSKSKKRGEELQIELGKLAKEKTKFANEMASKEAEFADKETDFAEILSTIASEKDILKEREATFEKNMESLVSDKDNLSALHNKDMKKFQAEIEFLIKEKTDLTNKHDKEITKFKIESEKKKGDIKSLKEKSKRIGADEEITSLLKEQTKQIEALTEALANAEQQLEIETNRPKMEPVFIDPLEKGAGADLMSHIEIEV